MGSACGRVFHGKLDEKKGISLGNGRIFSLSRPAMAWAPPFASSQPVLGHSGEINCSEEQLPVHDKRAFGEVIYAKIHLRNVFTLLSRFVEKIIYSLQERQISPLACKSQLPAPAIMSLYQCNIFLHTPVSSTQ